MRDQKTNTPVLEFLPSLFKTKPLFIDLDDFSYLLSYYQVNGIRKFKPSGRIIFYFDADYPLKVQREPRLESHSLFQSPFFRKECATQSDPLDEEDAPPSLVIYEVLPLKGAD